MKEQIKAVPPHLRVEPVGKDHPDLLMLVGRLDAYYYEKYGEEALHYKKYNGLEEVKFALVLYRGDEPVGCGCLKHIGEDTAELKRIYIAPEVRRSGLASLLVDRLEEQARAEGRRTALVETGAAMTDAIALYRKKGYTRIPNYGDFAGDDDCVCMQKELEARA